MKAMVLREVGKPLELAERPNPEQQSGELLVRVEAWAVFGPICTWSRGIFQTQTSSCARP